MNKILLITAILIFNVSAASAQCCSAGNPFFYGELSSLSKNKLQFVVGYKYSTSHQYYTKDSPLDIDFVDKAYFNFLTIQTIYGLSERFTIQADLGYFINKSETYIKDDWDNLTGNGLGDANVSIKYVAYSNYKRKIKLIPSLGVTLPIGVFDQEIDNVKLPITVQPSSGSFKYQLGFYATKGSVNNKFNYTIYSMFEYAQLIDSKNFYYKYGNQFLLSVLTSYKVSGNFSVALEARSENRGKSLRNNDQTVESSGYNIVYLVPHLSWSINKSIYLAVNTDLPIYKYYNGIQLSNTYSVSARISYSIN
jgi:hypothetical protein